MPSSRVPQTGDETVRELTVTGTSSFSTWWNVHFDGGVVTGSKKTSIRGIFPERLLWGNKVSGLLSFPKMSFGEYGKVYGDGVRN